MESLSVTSGSTKVCDIHSSNEAVQWCSLCDQALCLDCIEYHSQANATKSHKTIPMADFMKLPSLVRSMNKNCEQHDDRLDYFCSLHESVCCFNCLQSVHKQCESIERVQKLAENVKYSAYIDDLGSNIEDVLINMDKVIRNRIQNISNIDKQKGQILKTINEHKIRIISKLDKLEQKFKNYLSDMVKQERSRLDKFINDLKKRKCKISQYSEELTAVKELASDVDVFLSVNELRKNVQPEVSYLQSLQTDSDLQTAEIVLDTTKLLDNFGDHIQVFGNILVNKKPTKIHFKETNKSQAQFFSTGRVNSDSNVETLSVQLEDDHCTKEAKTVNDSDPKKSLSASESLGRLVDEIGLTYESSFSIPGEHMQIVSCKILTDDQFVFLDFDNKKLVLYRNNSAKYIPTSCSPIDVTFLGNNICAVTLYSDNAICLIDIAKEIEIRRYIVMGKCFGIDHSDNTLYVTLPHILKIQILEKESKTLKLRAISTTRCAFYVKYNNEMLFCSNHIERNVFCVTVTGLHLWDCHSNILLEPFCLTLSSNGDLYASCKKKKSVVLISSDGKSSRAVMNDIPAVKNPRAIDFCPLTNKFIVCDERSGLCIMCKSKEKFK